ncbi:MAG: ligase-associated DNA damage response endonuclease PdeM [Verrucomicrobiota bacterium]
MPAIQIPDFLATELVGEKVHLHPFGALFWPKAEILTVTDLHFGKEASFRKAGFPVPDGGMQGDLAKLSNLLERTKSRQLIITGDLLHARSSLTNDVTHEVTAWRDQYPDLSIQLTLGNHDRQVPKFPAQWRIDIHPSQLIIPPFVFQHDPTPNDDGYVIAGHLHPVFCTRAKKRSASLRLPCFHFTENFAVLPAFGHFTGGHPIDRLQNDRVFVIADDQIIEV